MNSMDNHHETLRLITATQSIGFDVAELKIKIGLVASMDRADCQRRLDSVADRQRALLRKLVDLRRMGESNGFVALDQELWALKGAVRQLSHRIKRLRHVLCKEKRWQLF